MPQLLGRTHMEQMHCLLGWSMALMLLIITISTSQLSCQGHLQAQCSTEIAMAGRGQPAASAEAILIQSDSDFLTQGWPGNGSSDEPYLIESIGIFGYDPAITIRNTRAHFVIRECVISGSGTESGLEFDNVSHGCVEACRFENLSCALDADRSNYTIVRGCSVLASWDGLVFSRCSGGLIDSNSVNGTGGGFGVGVFTVENMRMVNNTLETNSVGFYLYEMLNSSILGNTVYDNDIGIDIVGVSQQNRLYGNTIGPNTDNNAVDNGVNNMWDDGVSQGNVWSDYTGVLEYAIPGTAGSVDRYPRAISSTTSTVDQFPWDMGLRLVLTVAAAGLLSVFIALTPLQRRKASPKGLESQGQEASGTSAKGEPKRSVPKCGSHDT